MRLITSIRKFLAQDIWDIRTSHLPGPKRIPLSALKLLLATARGFQEDAVALRANALTLNSLLAIVPVLALLFGIAKGFGLEKRFQGWILSQFPEQQTVLGQSLVFAQRALASAQGGLVAGAGVIFLLYAVVQVIGQVEQAMNHIWSIARPRTLSRKFSDYISLILVGPFLLLGASSLNVYVTTWVHTAAESSSFAPVLGPAARAAIRTLPYVLLWMLFSFTYVFLPNTKVKIGSGLLGGAAAALLYQAAQSLYLRLQIGVSRDNAIYGSFAALPLFIIWLRVSWNIALFGAELTQQHQNFSGNESAGREAELSFREVKRIALDVCAFVLGRFEKGQVPALAREIGEGLRVPMKALGTVLKRLVAAGLLVETESPGGQKDPGYLPARPRESLTPMIIVDALERQGEEVPLTEPHATDPGESILARWEERLRGGGDEPSLLSPAR
ncbi:MAG: YihY/virulence factor BrkB family protein [Fibrobacteres bacterium]|nr:YihY/virulence factor BrkB family protein [Fibrobacterota bacterium]